jgi:hypothetical protein
VRQIRCRQRKSSRGGPKHEIRGEKTSGLEELTDETGIGSETRRDEVCRYFFTQTFHTPELSTVSEVWANTKTLIEEDTSDLERKQKRSILQTMGDQQRFMKALMEHAMYGIEERIVNLLKGSDKKRCMEGNNKTW